MACDGASHSGELSLPDSQGCTMRTRPRSSGPRTPPNHRCHASSFGKSFSRDRKSTRLNSSHSQISYAVFCLKKKKQKKYTPNNTAHNDKQTVKKAAHHIRDANTLCKHNQTTTVSLSPHTHTPTSLRADSGGP